MTSALRDVLDDAADDAVEPCRVDLAEVRARSRRRRGRLRGIGTTVMLAAAAAVAAALAVPLALTTVLQPDASVSPVGLPERWYFTPSFAPPVTRVHMAAASMLLAGESRAPVLVSADARTYARLPWGPDDTMAALSADGTRIAWARQGANRSTIYVLRLSDGHRAEIPLEDGSGQVGQVLWAGGQVYATTSSGLVTRIDAGTGKASLLCTCSLRGGLGVNAAGHLVQASVPGIELRGLPDVPEVPVRTLIDAYPAPDAPSWARVRDVAVGPTWSYVSSPVLAVAPDGQSSASVERANARSGWQLLVTGGEKEAISSLSAGADVTVADAEILAWTGAGILLRLDTVDDGSRGSSLRLVSPDGTRARTVSVRYESVAGVPMAVASGLVGDGTPVKAGAPHYPTWDRGRFAYAAQQLWRSNYPYWQLMTLAAVAAGTALLVLRRRRGRSVPR